MKKILAATLMISAIHWLSPAYQFNIVEANETVQNAYKEERSAHGRMALTHLNASLQYLDGLAKQLGTGAAFTNAVVRRHLTYYSKEVADSLKLAQDHLNQYSGTLSRAPAAELRSGAEVSEDLADARRYVDRAVNLTRMLEDRLSANVTASQKESFEKQIATIRGTIRDALDDTEDLI